MISATQGQGQDTHHVCTNLLEVTLEPVSVDFSFDIQIWIQFLKIFQFPER